MAEKPWRDIIAVSELEENWVTRVDVSSRRLAIYDAPSGVYASLALCNHGERICVMVTLMATLLNVLCIKVRLMCAMVSQ